MSLLSTLKQKGKCFKQTGISLLEVLLSVGIIAVILVLATLLYGRASSSQLINVLTTNMGAFSDAQTRYALNNGGVYLADTGAGAATDAAVKLANLGYLSAPLAGCTGNAGSYTACKVPNPWGGAITAALSGTPAGSIVTLSGKADNLANCNQINEQNKTNMTCNTTSLVVTKVLGS